MTIEKARNLLDALEEIKKNPETILTNFPDTDAEFLFSIDFDGVPLCEFVKKELEHQPLFCGCSIENEYQKGAFVFSVNIPSLGYRRPYQLPEMIAYLFPRKQEFIILHNSEKHYKNEMYRTITFQPYPVSDLEKQFQDLSLKGRMKNLTEEWMKAESFWLKIQATCYWLIYVPFHKKKCIQAFEKARRKRTDTDKYRSRMYQEELSRKNYYQNFAPNHLVNMKKKQDEIREYLLENGYLQVCED